MISEAVAPLINIGGGFIGSGLQALFGKSYAQQQYDRDLKMMKFQMDYNSPVNQRKRFEEAGLNPALMYGQGSPGNLDRPPQYPQIKQPDFSFMQAGLGTTLAQMELMKAQADLTNQKVSESSTKQVMMEAQTALMQNNPHMRKEYVDSMVRNLTSVADLKEQEAGFMLSKTRVDGVGWDRGFLKMQRELDLLDSKFNLQSADAKIKAQVLESKEFQNWINDFTRRFMADGEVNRDHIMYFVKMIVNHLLTASYK